MIYGLGPLQTAGCAAAFPPYGFDPPQTAGCAAAFPPYGLTSWPGSSRHETGQATCRRGRPPNQNREALNSLTAASISGSSLRAWAMAERQAATGVTPEAISLAAWTRRRVEAPSSRP